jgi:hypothetical protein
MHVKRNTDGRLCNHSYSGKAVSITYSEYVYVPLGIQHPERMRNIVICGLPRSTIFFQITS